MDVGHLLTNIPQKHKYQNVRAGDTVRVHYQVVEGERVRTQVLQGVVIWMTRGGPNANITIRRVIQGIGVERTFLLNSPRLEQIEVIRQGRVRRARLYYQRGRTGRKARIREGTRPRSQTMDPVAIAEPEPDDQDLPEEDVEAVEEDLTTDQPTGGDAPTASNGSEPDASEDQEKAPD